MRSQIYQELPLLELDTFMNCKRFFPIELNVSFFVLFGCLVFFMGGEGVFTKEPDSFSLDGYIQVCTSSTNV